MSGWLKNIFLIILLIAVVIASFWISFMMGKQILVPVKKLPGTELISGEATLPPPLIPSKLKFEIQGDKKAPVRTTRTVSLRPAARRARSVAPGGDYFVQVGVFAVKDNADKVISVLTEKGIAARRIAGKYHVVLVGSDLSLKSARRLEEKIKSLGLDAVVRRNNK